ncbi:hypothetical protein Tco_0015630 [Tanacetum coccineum]
MDDLVDSALVKCPMLPPNNLGPDESGVSVNETLFEGMIGSPMYLTSSRPDIQFSTCLYVRYQANPKESHLVAVKRIFRYLKGTSNLGLWYPKGSGFDLKAYSDSDYAGCNLDRKSTSGGCQILGGKLVCWSAKTQSSVAMSSAEAEYVAAAGCCAQVLWIKSQLADYDVLYDKGLNVDIGNIIFSDLIAKLQNGKKGSEPNVCYTRFLSLMIEHLLVAKLLPEPEETLILPSGGVNADDTADKSLSETDVQLVHEHIDEEVVEDFGIKSLGNVSFYELYGNDENRSVDANPFDTESKIKFIRKEVPKPITQLNPSKFKDKFTNVVADSTLVTSLFLDEEMKETDSDLESMPDDEIMSMSDNDEVIDDSEELSKDDEDDADHVIVELVHMENTEDAPLNVFATSSRHVSTVSSPSSPRNIQVLIAKVVWEKKNIPRVKIPNIQPLGSMRRFKEIQITQAPGSDPLGHLLRILDFLSAKVHNVAKNTPPELTQQFNTAAHGILKIVSDALAQALPKFDKRVQKTLKAGVDELVLKPLHKEFNALNTLEIRRFVILQNQLSKAIKKTLISYLEQLVHSTVKVPRDIMVINAKQLQTKVEKNDADIFELVELTREIVKLMELAPAFNTASAKGEKESQKQSTSTEDVPSPARGEQVVIDSTNKEVPTSAQEEQESSDQVVLDDIPIPSPTLPNLIRPLVIFNNIPYDQFTANLFSSGTSEFSPTPPSKVADKEKGKAQISKDDQMKQLLPLMDQGGSTPKISNLDHFRAAGEGPVTFEEAEAQMEEIKRLAELKAEKEKSDKRPKKVMTPDKLKAQAEGLARYEAKRAKMLEEYNHCISFKATPLPITKISYRIINSTKEASMRITRNHQPLNLTVYDKFVLKMLGFSEWLELHDLASKVKNKSNDHLLKNLKAKFQWVATLAGKLGIPPPPKLTAFELPPVEKKTNLKRKRMAEVIHEVFVKGNIVVQLSHVRKKN